MLYETALIMQKCWGKTGIERSLKILSHVIANEEDEFFKSVVNKFSEGNTCVVSPKKRAVLSTRQEEFNVCLLNGEMNVPIHVDVYKNPT